MSILEEVKAVINKLEESIDSESWDEVEESTNLLEETYYRMLHGDTEMFNEFE